MSDAEIASARELIVDCASLCKLLRGESQACQFDSVMSETLMAIALQHLCTPEGEQSPASRELLPVVDEHLTFGGGLRASIQVDPKKKFSQGCKCASLCAEPFQCPY
jgi:hypothetical protein